MDATLSHITANGIDFAYFEAGSGPLALLLHGYPDSAYTWRHFLPTLADAGYHAVAPFSRGYAPTSLATDGRYQPGILGVDANALHEALGGDGDAVLIGHDWGAIGAYAATHVAPERWRRVVCASIPPGPVNAQGYLHFEHLQRSWYLWFQLNPLADMIVPSDDYDFIRHLWATWSPGYDSAEDVAHFIECMATPDHLAAALGYYRQMLDPTLHDPALADAQAGTLMLPTIPLLVMHGRNDGCFSHDLAAQTPAFFIAEGSRFATIEDAGHFAQLEQPDAFAAEVLAFLAEP